MSSINVKPLFLVRVDTGFSPVRAILGLREESKGHAFINLLVDPVSAGLIGEFKSYREEVLAFFGRQMTIFGSAELQN
jgi:hypothetical protein